MTAYQLFGTQDLYEILELQRDAQINDGKKNALHLLKKCILCSLLIDRKFMCSILF